MVLCSYKSFLSNNNNNIIVHMVVYLYTHSSTKTVFMNCLHFCYRTCPSAKTKSPNCMVKGLVYTAYITGPGRSSPCSRLLCHRTPLWTPLWAQPRRSFTATLRKWRRRSTRSSGRATTTTANRRPPTMGICLVAIAETLDSITAKKNWTYCSPHPPCRISSIRCAKKNRPSTRCRRSGWVATMRTTTRKTMTCFRT